MKHLTLLLLALLLAGCLNVDTTVELNRDGSGRIDIVYEIDSDLYGVGVFDGTDNALPIPVSRDEFQQSVDRIDGLELKRYREREGDTAVVISARLAFQSVAALDQWYSAGAGAITLETQGDTTTWRQLVYPGNGSDGDVGAALASSLEGYILTFRLEPGSRVIAAGAGEIADNGRAATLSVPLANVITATSPLIWEVMW